MKIATSSNILSDTPPSVSKYATTALQDLGVTIKLNAKVVDTYDIEDGQKVLLLSDGTKLGADLYIPTFGLIPNSTYVPAKALNSKGFVMVDGHLKVKGLEDVWAIGDVSDIEPCQFITCDRQSVYLAKSLVATLQGRTPPLYKVASKRMFISTLRQFLN